MGEKLSAENSTHQFVTLTVGKVLSRRKDSRRLAAPEQMPERTPGQISGAGNLFRQLFRRETIAETISRR